jgi:hypothetical protein
MSIGTQFTRELLVPLTEDECQLHGKMLAEKTKEVAAIREQKTAADRGFTARIKAVELEIKRLAETRTKGEEMRPVLCVERVRNGVVEVVRLDRNPPVVVDTRPADMTDLQTTIPETDERMGDVLPFAPVDDGPPVGPGLALVPDAPPEETPPEETGNVESVGVCMRCTESIGADDETVQDKTGAIVHLRCIADDGGGDPSFPPTEGAPTGDKPKSKRKRGGAK